MEIFDKLRNLKDMDELEFKYQLRNLIKKSHTENLYQFKAILNEFKKEVIYDSFFFIDTINEGLFYYYLCVGNEENIEFEDIMEVFSILAPIGNRDTLEILYHVLKRLPRHSQYYPILMNYYGEIEHKISFLEQKIKKLKLYPPRSIIVDWHE